MDAERKAKIKAIMDEHLKSLGWPNVPNPDQLVINQLEPMFRLLLKAELVKYADYEPFVLSAIAQAEKAHLRRNGFPV
jgi:hypothetical protein